MSGTPHLKTVRIPQVDGIEVVFGLDMNHEFKEHIHQDYVIGMITGGQRLMSLKGRMYSLLKGDVFLLNPGEAHACISGGTGGHNYAVLIIAREAMESLYGLPGCLPRFEGLDKVHSGLGQHLDHVFRLVEYRESPQTILSAIRMMFDDALRPVCHAVQAGDVHPSAKGSFKQACDYISRHSDETVSLDHLARLSNQSPWHFHKQFKYHIGTTPHGYLTAQKLRIARQLLGQSLSIADIACRLGFADQSHFSRVFKQNLGVSPARYRQGMVL